MRYPAGLVQREDLDALIGRAQEGDVRAFEVLLSEHVPSIRRFARAFAATEPDADDLAQDALLKAYRSLRQFRYQCANIFVRHGRHDEYRYESGPLLHEWY